MTCFRGTASKRLKRHHVAVWVEDGLHQIGQLLSQQQLLGRRQLRSIVSTRYFGWRQATDPASARTTCQLPLT
jgi:hypothetical protein